MPRVKGGPVTRRRRKKVLEQAEGYWGKRKSSYRTAQEAVDRALRYAYRDRRTRKRDMRGLWIVRINAAARENEISYSRLMEGLKKAGNDINRKMLADLAVTDPGAFTELVGVAKQALASA